MGERLSGRIHLIETNIGEGAHLFLGSWQPWRCQLCDHRRLADNVVVSVAELACHREGCPHIETVICLIAPGRKIEILQIHSSINEIRLSLFGYVLKSEQQRAH